MRLEKDSKTARVERMQGRSLGAGNMQTTTGQKDTMIFSLVKWVRAEVPNAHLSVPQSRIEARKRRNAQGRKLQDR